MSQSKLNKYSPSFTEATLDISQIEYRCYVWKLPKTQKLAGLIVFTGAYMAGSAGKDDALFIKWKINEFCELELPQKISGLVVDFRGLNYEWGDDLDVYPQEIKRLGQPVKVVVTPEKYEIFKGVLDEKELSIDIEVAFAEVMAALK